jgi:hypothetical protein
MNDGQSDIKGLPSGEPVVILSKQEYDTLCLLVEETGQRITNLENQVLDLRENLKAHARKISLLTNELDVLANELASSIESLIDETGAAVRLGDVVKRLKVSKQYLHSMIPRLNATTLIEVYQKPTGRKEMYFKKKDH